MKWVKLLIKESFILYFDILGMLVYLLRFPGRTDKKRILILRPDHFGDVLLTTPAVRFLRAENPEAQIDILIKSYSRDALKNNSDISSIIELNLPWACHAFQKKAAFSEIISFIFRCRRIRYNEIYILQEDWRNNILAGLCGADRIHGYGDCGCASYLTDCFQVPKNGYHEVEKTLKPVCGIVSERRLYYTPDSDAEKKALEFLRTNSISGRFAVLHPGAGYYKRCWTEDGFATIAQNLSQSGITPILCYTGDDEKRAEKIISNAPVIPLVDYPLDIIAAIIKKSCVFIGHDSGPMHLATAVNCPVAAIFGPSDPKRWGPWSDRAIVIRNEMDCMPCGSKPDCNHVKCLQKLNSEFVWEKIQELLEKY